MAPPSDIDVLDPFSDPRFTHNYATLTTHRHRYHYLLAQPPSGTPTRTVLLIHGWPDLSIGWRYQIPALLAANCRVIVPDMLGYGRSESPPVPPNPQSVYGFRNASDAIAELARLHVAPAEKIVLAGHDWGGAVVYRTCLYYPELVSELIAVCTPYTAPSRGPYRSLEEVVAGRLPNLRYQVQLASGEVQKVVRTPETIRQFLNGLYGGRGEGGEALFTTEKGILLESLGKIGRTPLMSEREMEYYVQEYCRNGLDGNLNWYKTTKVNYDDDRQITDPNINIPVLFIFATRDAALPEHMSQDMEAKIPRLTRKKVEAGHWALWQKPAEINKHISDFLHANGALQARSSHL